MHIIELNIKNFRGIKSFNHIFGEKQLVCLVGQGDSGKTTILEAISLALSPTWNIPFCDNDFYLKNIKDPIQIEVSVKIPETFVLETKFGLICGFGIQKIIQYQMFQLKVEKKY
jgi:predicted ATP-dependent endonuclease of OLD family